MLYFFFISSKNVALATSFCCSCYIFFYWPLFENICLWAAVSVLDLQEHTEQQERPDFEVHDLLQMNIHGVVGVVQGVSLDTKRSAGHDIQTERSHKPVTGRREDKRTRSVCSLKPDTVTSSRSPTFTLLPVLNLSANPDRSHSQATSHDLIRETKKRNKNLVLFDINGLVLCDSFKFFQKSVGVRRHRGKQLEQTKGLVSGWLFFFSMVKIWLLWRRGREIL